MSNFQIIGLPVYVGGSRSLAASHPAANALMQFCAGLARGGARFRVGCASGADALALSIIPARQVCIFAQFARSGAGAFRSSNVSGVNHAAQFGASVHWQAGGQVSSVPVKARLIQRSRAALQGCGVAVFFAPGHGSLSVARHALAAGKPVLIWAQNRTGFVKLAGTQQAKLIKCCGLLFWLHEPQDQKLF